MRFLIFIAAMVLLPLNAHSHPSLKGNQTCHETTDGHMHCHIETQNTTLPDHIEPAIRDRQNTDHP